MNCRKGLVSIIIPAYNAQRYIRETIESILASSYRNIEIIVVDDGSTDETLLIAKSFGLPVFCFSQDNSGGCAIPRNHGISKSSGEFLCFMDADDLVTVDRLSDQVDFLERYSNVALVFCDYRNFSDSGTYQNSHFQTCPGLSEQLKNNRDIVLETACPLLAQENFGSAGSLMVRKASLLPEFKFEASLKSSEDYHFYFRLARQSPVGIINKVGMLRRLHGDNMTRNVERMMREGIRCRSMLIYTEKNPHVRRLLNRYVANCNAGLARYYANQRFYSKSFQHIWRILAGPFCWQEFKNACTSTVRTIAIALNLHVPDR